jgi:hypothetical protein
MYETINWSTHFKIERVYINSAYSKNGSFLLEKGSTTINYNSFQNINK